ncbi:hypothetical protein C5167_027725 [Papaver somniferum]|nr:hypothetical protein C5167_027725 [Papaver somniferum]
MSEDQRENAKIRKEMHISMERILPSELTFEIFSHLPADSIIQCREVCTAWRDLIGHPSDIYMHLQRLSHPNGEPLLDIWFLRKQGESGTLESFDLNEQDDYDSLIWIKKFSIPTGCQAAPCALTNSGEVLLLCRSSLFCYNPETANLERLIDEGISHVFPHMNRFVSLKALGENCKLRKRYGVNPAPKEIFLKLQREEDTQDTSCSYSLDA